MKPAKIVDYKGYGIKIYQDETPIDPRSNDNLGTMVCWHKRHELGDKHNYEANHELLTDLAKIETLNAYVGDIMKEVEKHCVLINLFLYDHSGITMSTSPFSCKWDSGQVGYIYVTREKLKAEQLADKSDEEIKEILKAEVEEYDQFLTGEVYGYEITDAAGLDIDSCWGYFGGNFEENGLLPQCRATIDAIESEPKKYYSITTVGTGTKTELIIAFEKVIESLKSNLPETSATWEDQTACTVISTKE